MEKFLHHIWQHRLLPKGALATIDGEPVEVLDPGLLNTDAGPDFFNAKVRIADRVWAGNVEIHVRASDWMRHGHHTDPAYDSVVLHVVAQSDARVTRTDGTPIPQMVMGGVEELNERHRALASAPATALPCVDVISSIPGIYITDWLTSLAFERLHAKVDRVLGLFERVEGDWRSVVYVVLARALGFSTNSDAFERLALSVPLRALMHHQGSPVSVEALLFGHAGMLSGARSGSPEEAYMNILRQEHAFLATKYGLGQPRTLGWRMARMRPQSFPHRRVALLAAMVSGGFLIGQTIFTVSNVDEARALFRVPVSKFWQEHFTFAPSEGFAGGVLSGSTMDSLIINVVAPVIYAFGERHGRPEMQERAADILSSLAPERNSIVRGFTDAGIPCPDALTSQALIQLRRAYCEPRKCLYCRIGHRCLTRR
ncbi:MAG: DUF2851 family protein [Muribaculaceae bacterium]|nr:DUF2851 family protein [Muribaculaceae bacterium]